MPAHHVCSMIFIHVEYLRFGNQTHHEPNEMTEWYAVIDYTIIVIFNYEKYSFTGRLPRIAILIISSFTKYLQCRLTTHTSVMPRNVKGTT